MASLAIRRAGSAILLLERARAPHAGLWTPPGGKAEPGEAPSLCASREFEEETGVAFGEARLIAVLSETGASDASNWLLFAYLADGPGFEAPPPGAEGRWRWVELARIGALAIPESDAALYRHLEAGAAFVLELACRYDARERLIGLERARG